MTPVTRAGQEHPGKSARTRSPTENSSLLMGVREVVGVLCCRPLPIPLEVMEVMMVVGGGEVFSWYRLELFSVLSSRPSLIEC